jgi:hypothetical protein
MSDTCPVLTDKDIELMGRFRNEIAKIQADTNKLFQECDITKQTGGGFKETFIDTITNVIVLCITALAYGATAAFFINVIPDEYQKIILTLVNRRLTLPMCDANDVLGTTTTTLLSYIPFLNAPSCEERAQLFWVGIKKIQVAAGVVTGVTGAALRDKIKIYITRIIDGESVPSNSDTKTNISERGGRRKSRSGKRKSRKSRKIRRIKKH